MKTHAQRLIYAELSTGVRYTPAGIWGPHIHSLQLGCGERPVLPQRGCGTDIV